MGRWITACGYWSSDTPQGRHGVHPRGDKVRLRWMWKPKVIRALFLCGWDVGQIAEAFGVTASYIQKRLRGAL